jgi:hypothetical protein
MEASPLLPRADRPQGERTDQVEPEVRGIWSSQLKIGAASLRPKLDKPRSEGLGQGSSHMVAVGG